MHHPPPDRISRMPLQGDRTHGFKTSADQAWLHQHHLHAETVQLETQSITDALERMLAGSVPAGPGRDKTAGNR